MKEKSVVQQRIEKFEQRHGGRKVAVRSTCGSYWLYPDGARRDVHLEGMLEDLPEVHQHPYRGNREALDWEILNRRVQYCASKATSREADFSRQREAMANRDYSDADWQELERLGKLVSKARNELDAVLKEKDAHPRAVSQRTAQEAQAVAQARIEEKAKRLNKMRI